MRAAALQLLFFTSMAHYVLSFQARVGKHLFSNSVRTPSSFCARAGIRLFSVDKKRVVFLGTPEVAASSLKRLYEESQKDDSPYQIVSVITQPPRRRKRQGKLEPSPVGKVAEDLGIPVLHPEKVCVECAIYSGTGSSASLTTHRYRQKILSFWMIWRTM
jgi:hypothetical protein